MNILQMEHINAQLAHLRNVVVLIHIGCTFPTPAHMIAMAVETQGHYDPDVFPAVICHLRSTNCTLSIFSTGRVMATGAASEHRAYNSALMLCDTVNRLWPHRRAQLCGFRVVNRVAHIKLGVDLDMDRLSRRYRWSGLYEPKSFPGMKIQMIDLGVTFVVFRKEGKMNIAGIPELRHLPFIAQRAHSLLQYAQNTG